VLIKLLQSRTVSAWSSFFFRTFANIGVTVFAIKYFDINSFSVWMLFSTVIAFFSLIDLGFSPTFIRLISYARSGLTSVREIGNNSRTETLPLNKKLFLELTWYLKNIYKIISILMLFFMLLIAPLFLEHQISLLPNPENGWYAWYILAVGSSLTLWSKGYDSILRGMDKVLLANYLDSFFFFLAGLLMILYMLYSPSLITTVSIFSAVMSISAITKYIVTKKKYTKLICKKKCSDSNVKDVIIKSSLKTGIMFIGGPAVLHLSAMILSMYVDAAILASYLLALKFITLTCEVSSAPFFS